MALEQERQRRKEDAKIKKGKAGSCGYNMLHCRYQFACVFSSLDLTCMVLHVFIFYHGMRFSRFDSISSLALPFLDSFDEMGSLIWFMWDDRIRFKANRGGSLN